MDAEVLIVPHFSGIGHYTLELLRALDKHLDNRDDIEVTLGVYFKRRHTIRSYGFKNFRYKLTPFPLRISNGLKIRGKQPFYDLFFGKYIYLFPNFTSWPVLFSKTVPIVYDLSFEYHKQYTEPRNQQFLSKCVREAVNRADKVVTISTNSKKEIVDFYDVPEKNISIIYPGIDQTQFYKWPELEVARVKAHYGIHGKYILFVGNIEPRKNLKNLLLAYEKLPDAMRKEYSLLLVGARGWLDNEIFDIIERLRMAGNVIQQPNGWVEDKHRAALYSGASLFVYPSKYEGFGIPPLEAMACGAPVITSDNSSLPEAVGDAAIKVKAESVTQLAKQMEKTLQLEHSKLNDMARKGFIHVDTYTWEHESLKLIDVLKEVDHG